MQNSVMCHTSQYAFFTWDLLDCAVEGLDYFIVLFDVCTFLSAGKDVPPFASREFPI